MASVDATSKLIVAGCGVVSSTLSSVAVKVTGIEPAVPAGMVIVGWSTLSWLAGDMVTVTVTSFGDGVPIDVEPYADADILMHEATFLEAADRENYVHSTLDEAVDQAVAARAGNLVLFHLSSRYPRREMRRAIPRALAARGFDPARAWLVYERHWDNAAALG